VHGESKLQSPVVDTGQDKCYDNRNQIIHPRKGGRFYGQDAQYAGKAPSYTIHGDGTVTDNLTGLIWLKNADCFGARDWANALTDCNNLANATGIAHEL